MANIPYPSPESLSAETSDVLVKLGSLNVTRMMAHSTPVLDGYSRFGLKLLRKGRLDPVIRELVILRVGVLCQCPYEWHQHEGLARAMGAKEAAIEAVRAGGTEAMSEVEQRAVAFADDICGDGVVSRDTLTRAQVHFSPEELVELTLVCGYYLMTAAFLKTFDIEIEDTPPLGATIAAQMLRAGRQPAAQLSPTDPRDKSALDV